MFTTQFWLTVYITLAKVLFPSLAKVSTKLYLQQMALETASFTSNYFKTYNNVAGLKKPEKRKFWGNGEAGSVKHATYAHKFLSVLDLFERNEYFRKLKGIGTIATDESYLDFLHKTGYAEDVNYIQKIPKLTVSDFSGIMPPLVLAFFLGFSFYSISC